MEILYISSVPSKNQFDFIKQSLKPHIDEAKYGMQESGYKFHTLIMNGMINDENNHIFSIVGRPTSYKTHRGIIWKKVVEIKQNIKYHHVGFLNLPFIRNIMISMAYFYNTLKWLLKNKKNQDKIIIMDASYITVIPFVILASKIIKCNTIAIVCDIYEYMADVKDAREKKVRVHSFISKIMKKIYSKINGFVFLTEQMDDVMNSKNVPYIVMEGLVDHTMKNAEVCKKNAKDVIMYAGALRAQYGLKNLVEGFRKYKNANAELWICGAGDYVPDIKAAAKEDNRIKFLGILPNETVVKKEQEASLLVNPRPANQEFTKYSFPSKNMEYMVSGTSLLTTRLPGMPKEYYDYIFTIDGDDENDITVSLDKVFSLPKKEIDNCGKKAKKFVLEKKNNIAQAERILKLGRNLNEKNGYFVKK